MKKQIFTLLLLFITVTCPSFAKRVITRFDNGVKQTLELNQYRSTVSDFKNQYFSCHSNSTKRIIGDGDFPTFMVNIEYDESQNIVPILVHAGYPDWGLYWNYEGENSFEVQIPEEIKVLECVFGKSDENGDLTAL